MTHAEFLTQLQAPMLELTEEDFAQVRSIQHHDLQHVYKMLTYNMLTCVGLAAASGRRRECSR
ncbi:hypothetical protein JG688_00018421 [Phytophthora aleatoria]|uniref:Uncharacterized protein n=1 Tax=Phytophthora aleatoria TaxID=2496075 RepID=A0A8J5M0M6_9STRA|nr:hypothetical protein JG688_00018421 [Phytophthora aleatoria]